MASRIWVLEDARNLIQPLQEVVNERFGYHITLGGSVLNKGESLKDVDLYFLPFDNPKYKEDVEGLVQWLADMWGKPKPIGIEYNNKQMRNNLGIQFDINGNRLVQPRVIDPNFRFENIVFNEQVKESKPYQSTTYRYKFKFVRPSGDRIDTFIV